MITGMSYSPSRKEILARYLEDGDVIVSSSVLGEYQLSQTTVTKTVFETGLLVEVEGMGRLRSSSASHETRRLRAFSGTDKVTVLR